jgi:hypothetical protein
VYVKATRINPRRGSAIKVSPLYSYAPCHGSPVGGPDPAPAPSPVLIPLCVRASAPLPSPKPRPARPVGRKHRRKLGRPRSKAWAKTARYLRSHQPKRLRRTEVLKLIQADQFATRTGRRLGTFITLRWHKTALGEAAINRRFSDLLNAARIWVSRRGIEWTALAVHENPPPSDKPTFNTHVLCNIPGTLHLAFTEWLVKQLGGSAGAIHIRPRVCPGWDADETLSYMLKGTDKATAMRFHLIRKRGWKYDQGIVPFRRCTVSHNIGTAAIAAWKTCGTIKKPSTEFSAKYARVRKAA